MGGSNQKIKVAIIDESQRQSDFQLLQREKNISAAYYDTYQKFLENQSLKKLSYIIIREKEINQSEIVRAQNSTIRKKIQNIRELSARFDDESADKNMGVRQKLLSYIKKYSLQKLVVYVLIRDALNYQVPQYDMPYLTMISDSLQAIVDHVKTRPKRDQPAIFKFRRLVKDLYRRSTVKVIVDSQENKYQSQWKRLLAQQRISVDFSKDREDFEQSLISSYSDYIIVSTPEMLTYLIDAKKVFQFDSKIIYFGSQQQVGEKQGSVWMVSKGTTSTYKSLVVEAIKRCSDLITDQTSARPRLTVIFTSQHYTSEEKKLIKEKVFDWLRNNIKRQDSDWISQMEIVITSNFSYLKDVLTKYVYAYMITFDCTNEHLFDLKAWLKKHEYANRVYIYSMQSKDGKLKSEQKQERMKQLSIKVEGMMKKASFKIKFEISPLDSIALFELGEKEYKYFSSKLGLVPVVLDEQQWRSRYCKQNREKIIDFYIVCNVQSYFDKLSLLLAKEVQDPTSYFKDIRVIIYDKQQSIRKRWSQITKVKSIGFVHYSLTKIQQFIDTLFVPVIKLSNFVKKSLPQYMQALKNIDQSKSRVVNLRGIIVSKNELLKEVFSQNVVTNIEFQLSFRHYSVTNRSSQQDIDDLYVFIAKFANLWRVGYEMTEKESNEEQLSALKKDIKACLYKCKSYSLLEVSDDQFDYFYIKKIDFCKTFLDLQIAVIYISTLPHGVTKILQQIFSRPKQNCMVPKVFAAFIVVLLSAFSSVEDEVMGNKNLVVYFDDENLSTKINSLNIGDILFNTSFIQSSKNESDISNGSNHCLFIEFDDIPMLCSSFIKNYLYIERFSFYKQSSEYLIAPYTKFQVKKKILNEFGKFHIYLHAINDEQKGFTFNVFKANQLDDKQLFNTIKQEIHKMNDESDLNFLTQQAKSLYKKAEIISLYEQKRDMLKSINDSLQYKNFLNAMNKECYLSALYHLNEKSKRQKMTTQIEAQYFKNMLGVQKSLVYFKMNEFDLSTKSLKKVQNYLGQEGNQWVLKKVIDFKNNMNSLEVKRQKLLNRCPKTKKWQIYAQKQIAYQHQGGRNEYKAVVKMRSKEVYWNVDYLQASEDFYISKTQSANVACLPYRIKQNYGQSVSSFTNQMLYQKKSLVDLHRQEEKVGKYLSYTLQKIEQKKSPSKQTNEKKRKRQFMSRHQVSLNIDEKQLDDRKKIRSWNVHQKIQQQNIFKEYESEKIKDNNERSQRKYSSFKLVEIQGKPLSSLLGVTEKMSWQSFYIGDKFVLTKKGKHMKGKMTTKMI